MATETIKTAEVYASQGAPKPEVKIRKLNECRVCGMKTYQKEALCVLCKTGITQAYGELK
jgi:ribosomal protein S14